MSEARKYDLEDRLVKFACLIIELVKKLPRDEICIHLGTQLLRSGTSAALNYGEALGAESRKDFIHKVRICLKELRESRMTARILLMTRYLQEGEPAFKECNELVAIFSKSVKTASKAKT